MFVLVVVFLIGLAIFGLLGGATASVFSSIVSFAFNHPLIVILVAAVTAYDIPRVKRKRERERIQRLRDMFRALRTDALLADYDNGSLRKDPSLKEVVDEVLRERGVEPPY